MPGGYIPVLYWLELVDEIKNLLFSLVSRNVTGIHPSLSLVQTPHQSIPANRPRMSSVGNRWLAYDEISYQTLGNDSI